MHNRGTAQKSSRNHNNRSSNQFKPPNAIWPRESEERLVYILVGLVEKGVRSFGTHLHVITDDLNEQCNLGQYTMEQVKQKIDRMKMNYKDFTMLLTGKVGTGFGWDQSTNTVTNNDQAWEQLKHVSVYSNVFFNFIYHID
jgi:hypothetical protein